MNKHGELAERYRNRAEELRVMAEDFTGPRRAFIFTLVQDYQRRADVEEKLAKQNGGRADH